jgi:CRISPR-associated protein Csh1
MLNTLLKIGEWQSQGKSEWDRFLDYPKVETKDKRGNEITNYTLPIIFDLDNEVVVIDAENLEEYDEDHVTSSLGIKLKGRNSKSIMASGPTKSFSRIFKSLFGKEGVGAENGELFEAIKKTHPHLLKGNFETILREIFLQKQNYFDLSEHKDKKEVDIKRIEEDFILNRNERIVYITTLLKSKKHGFIEPRSLSSIKEYEDFLNETYFGKPNAKSKQESKDQLCYASGDTAKDVTALNLTTRYSLNKMFVTETKNYASVFDKKKFSLNYQVSAENQERLDYASDYLLHQGYKVKIAGVDHIIIPQFLSTSNVDLEMTLEGISRKSDLLFNLHKFYDVSKTIKEEVDDEIFWINFLAFESDGNYFKSTELIKDVSNHQLTKIMKCLNDVDWEFKEAPFIDWNSAMMDYDYETKSRVRRNFNFNSIYKLIPLRKDKEKKNKALDIFKSILENRNTHLDVILDNFAELVLCHWYERYASYTNVSQYNKDYFSFAIRDSVFKYHAFIQLLKKLKLIDMSEQNQTSKTSENKYDKAETEFFNKMNLNQDQQAMFYLGRMLSVVEYIQKGKNKTVIQKVNFNGMDQDDIQRLRVDLIEKAKQYNAVNKVIFNDNKFGSLFNFNSWTMNSKEAVFHLLTGYSFGVEIKKTDDSKDKETIDTI